MEKITNTEKDVIGDELKKGCAELTNNILKLLSSSRRAFEMVINVELESPKDIIQPTKIQ